MSLSAISSQAATAYGAGHNPVARDWKDIPTALNNGDLAGARKAFASLQRNLANSPTGTPGPGTPVGKALASLQGALQDGDLSTTQSAFTTLRTAVRGGPQHALSATPASSTQENHVTLTSGSDADTSSGLHAQAGSGRLLYVFA